MKSIFLMVFSLSICISGLSKTVRIHPNRPLQVQFQKGAVTYRISDALDLKGKTLVIPDNATLSFRGGSIVNGTLSGSFKTQRVKYGSFQVKLKKGSSILSSFPVYNYSPEINASILSACVGGITLKEDIDISSDVNLRCSIDGKGHLLSASSDVAVVFRIASNKAGITIDNVNILRQYDGKINTNYAIYCVDSSNITLKNSSLEGRLYFANKTFSDNSSDISSHFVIKDCTLTCDLSSCPQGWEYGQDHISFYSIKDVTIENCKINSTNVNRIIKTSQFFSDQNFVDVSRCTDKVLFRKNIVKASCDYGKQMWDMFCGSTNISILENRFEINGFSRFIEDKAYQEKYNAGVLMSSNIRIANNIVITSGSDLFQFRTSPQCDSFEVIGNTFIMEGSNINPHTGYERNCGIYLQGYKQLVIAENVFEWKDEACGLLFVKMNFDCKSTTISNNRLTDVYRINMTSTTHPVSGKQMVRGESFTYHGNSKIYTSDYMKSREEIYVSDSDVKDFDVEIDNNTFVGSYEVIFAKEVRLGHFSYGSRAKDSKSIHNQTKTNPWFFFSPKNI